MATMSAAAGTPSPEEQARAAWAAIDKPVTEESFVAWYCKTHANKKAGPRSEPTAAPAAKRQALLPGAAAPSAAGLAKGKRQALLKAVGASLKAAVKGKKTKWHKGDSETLPGSTVCDAADFKQLFPDVTMATKGVTTSFALEGDALAAAFGDLKISVPTWSHTHRSFQKAHKTGSAEVSVASAEGKYSTGTSTLTIKFCLRVAGGCGDYGGFGGFGGFGLADY